MINAFEVVGVQKIKSKKNGQNYLKLNMVSVEPTSSENMIGRSISEAFVGDDCEIANFASDDVFALYKAHVRVFKEEVNGLDKITLISVLNLASPASDKEATPDKKAASK